MCADDERSIDASYVSDEREDNRTFWYELIVDAMRAKYPHHSDPEGIGVSVNWLLYTLEGVSSALGNTIVQVKEADPGQFDIKAQEFFVEMMLKTALSLGQRFGFDDQQQRRQVVKATEYFNLV